MTAADTTPAAPAAPAALTLLGPALAAALTEQTAIDRTAGRLADVIAAGGRVYTFGAGHSAAIAAEFCSRAGGLAAFTAMSLEDLRDTVRLAHLQYADSAPERDGANGPALLRRHGVIGADAVVIASQSGRNAASIELARGARQAGSYVVAVVSRQHCLAEPSRHPEGLRLIDVADDVIDNHCPVGDAAVAVAGQRAGATSTMAGALIAQLISVGVAEALARRGDDVQVILSANVDQAPA